METNDVLDAVDAADIGWRDYCRVEDEILADGLVTGSELMRLHEARRQAAAHQRTMVGRVAVAVSVVNVCRTALTVLRISPWLERRATEAATDEARLAPEAA